MQDDACTVCMDARRTYCLPCPGARHCGLCHNCLYELLKQKGTWLTYPGPASRRRSVRVPSRVPCGARSRRLGADADRELPGSRAAVLGAVRLRSPLGVKSTIPTSRNGRWSGRALRKFWLRPSRRRPRQSWMCLKRTAAGRRRQSVRARWGTIGTTWITSTSRPANGISRPVDRPSTHPDEPAGTRLRPLNPESPLLPDDLHSQLASTTANPDDRARWMKDMMETLKMARDPDNAGSQARVPV